MSTKRTVKRSMGSPKQYTTMVDLPIEMADKLEKLAKQHHYSSNEFLNLCLRIGLEHHDKQSDANPP